MKKNDIETSRQTPEALLDDLHALVAEAEKMVASASGERGSEIMNGLRNRFQATQERLGDLYDEAKKKVTAGAQNTDEVIRSNPYQSIAVAIGLGVLLGVLVGRKSSH
jgi:ElaB/YqjD/DUF883 family membrane-anchored ribosome-binding protein